jgi:AcrR family transcriptional regulator
MKTSSDLQLHRIRILCSAMQLFMDRGIKDVTMDEVSHYLKMSKRTLYELFENKEALLLEGIKYKEQQSTQLNLEFSKTANNILEVILYDLELKLSALDRVNLNFFSDLHKYPKVQEYLDRTESKRREKATLALKQGIKEGVFRPDIEVSLVIATLMHLQQIALKNEALDRYSRKEVFLNTIFIYMRGIATDRGLEMMNNFCKLHPGQSQI